MDDCDMNDEQGSIPYDNEELALEGTSATGAMAAATNSGHQKFGADSTGMGGSTGMFYTPSSSGNITTADRSTGQGGSYHETGIWSQSLHQTMGGVGPHNSLEMAENPGDLHGNPAAFMAQQHTTYAHFSRESSSAVPQALFGMRGGGAPSAMETLAGTDPFCSVGKPSTPIVRMPSVPMSEISTFSDQDSKAPQRNELPADDDRPAEHEDTPTTITTTNYDDTKQPPSKFPRSRPKKGGKKPPNSFNHAQSAQTAMKKSSRKKRRSIVINKGKRRGANGSISTLRFFITNDEEPDRLVNPLLDIPKATGNEQLHSLELLAMTQLPFHRPDTYPLSYLARLLGFDVPPPSNQPTGEESAVSLPPFPTPLGDVQKLPLLIDNKEKDAFFNVPPAHVSSEQRNVTIYRKVSNKGDWDDQHTLDFIDPVYDILLTHGYSVSELKAASSSWATKFAAQQTKQVSNRRHVTKMAQKLISLDSSWSFADWTSARSGGRKGGTTQLHRWTLDGKTVYCVPPPQQFGIVALYKNEPVATLIYQFQWYPIPASRSAGNGPGNLNPAGAKTKKESELVMVLQGIARRTNQKVTVVPGAWARSSFSGPSASKKQSQDSQAAQAPSKKQTTYALGIDASIKQSSSKKNEKVGTMEPSTSEQLSRAEDEDTNDKDEIKPETSNIETNGNIPDTTLKVPTEYKEQLVEISSEKDPIGQDNKTERAGEDSVGTKKSSSQSNSKKTSTVLPNAPDVNKNSAQSEMEIDDAIEGATKRADAKKLPEKSSLPTKQIDDSKAGISIQTESTALQENKSSEKKFPDGSNEIIATQHSGLSAAQEKTAIPTDQIDGTRGDTDIRLDPTKVLGTAPLPTKQIDDSVIAVMISLALEHTRACDVWYGLCDAQSSASRLLNEKCFRMVDLPRREGQINPMICDLKKCSAKYALLVYKMSQANDLVAAGPPEISTRERLLVRMPTMEEARANLDPKFAEQHRFKRAMSKVDSHIVVGATGRSRQVSLRLRAKIGVGEDASTVKITRIPAGSESPEEEEEETRTIGDELDNLKLDILRSFPVPVQKGQVSRTDDVPKDEVLAELTRLQNELTVAEEALAPKLRSLLTKASEERFQYEQPYSKQKRLEEKRVLHENAKIVERRKELDLAWQEQLEQDMNAVCNICNDGEVTPDNQILFCEACNVAVHQMCYGIEVVPEGDYYCSACRYFKREKMREETLVDKSSSSPAATLPPLPINCELCPVKEGAYIRTDTSKSYPNATVPKWVHMACAKWQGLCFLDRKNPEVVEDVTPLKIHFRSSGASCDICKGTRGAFNPCRYPGCNKFLHVTCARAIGVCEVIHGDDVHGRKTENAWTLLCQEHSNIDPAELAREPVPVEQLIRAARELPVEPVPDLTPFKRFTKMSGKERIRAMADPEYEAMMLDEVLTTKLFGVRCEVCYTLEDDGKNVMRCSDCHSVVCVTCQMDCEVIPSDTKNFKCLACRKTELWKAAKPDEEALITRPQCFMCNQKRGMLLEGFAKPVNKQAYWKTNQKEFSKTLFSKNIWTHYTCAFWLKGLQVDGKGCKVDCSNVVMSNGRSFVLSKARCNLCGLSSGLKVKCHRGDCMLKEGKRVTHHFHVTCARQAGLEVNHSDHLQSDSQFYVSCYVHGGNEFNLRARLEDLLEVEKKRRGKKLQRTDTAMKVVDMSRLLNHAILCMSMLGWAWRWAEMWVAYGSNWEPLLEPGQKEEEMTKEQLKVVDSTPDSRCDDARRCRLAAFGAALRNRDYDTPFGFDTASLNRALRAILHTKSLVGPLESYEIDFFVEWLSRAYRSKSIHLSFGDDKVRVSNEGFCVHREDGTPKYELGSRPLPGKHPLPNGQLFEDFVQEPDDFYLSKNGEFVRRPVRPVAKAQESEPNSQDRQNLVDSPKPSNKLKSVDRPKSVGSKNKRPVSRIDAGTPEQPRRKRGRPPLKRNLSNSPPPKNQVYSPGSVNKAASVAAMVPSAVKKRGKTGGKGPRPVVKEGSFDASDDISADSDTPEEGDDAALTPDGKLCADLVYEKLSHPEGLRKARRGRPPRMIKVYLVVKVNGESYGPDGPISTMKSNFEKNDEANSEGSAAIGRSEEMSTPVEAENATDGAAMVSNTPDEKKPEPETIDGNNTLPGNEVNSSTPVKQEQIVREDGASPAPKDGETKIENNVTEAKDDDGRESSHPLDDVRMEAIETETRSSKDPTLADEGQEETEEDKSEAPVISNPVKDDCENTPQGSSQLTGDPNLGDREGQFDGKSDVVHVDSTDSPAKSSDVLKQEPMQSEKSEVRLAKSSEKRSDHDGPILDRPAPNEADTDQFKREGPDRDRPVEKESGQDRGVSYPNQPIQKESDQDGPGEDETDPKPSGAGGKDLNSESGTRLPAQKEPRIRNDAPGQMTPVQSPKDEDPGTPISSLRDTKRRGRTPKSSSTPKRGPRRGKVGRPKHSLKKKAGRGRRRRVMGLGAMEASIDEADSSDGGPSAAHATSNVRRRSSRRSAARMKSLREAGSLSDSDQDDDELWKSRQGQSVAAYDPSSSDSHTEPKRRRGRPPGSAARQRKQKSKKLATGYHDESSDSSSVLYQESSEDDAIIEEQLGVFGVDDEVDDGDGSTDSDFNISEVVHRARNLKKGKHSKRATSTLQRGRRKKKPAPKVIVNDSGDSDDDVPISRMFASSKRQKIEEADPSAAG